MNALIADTPVQAQGTVVQAGPPDAPAPAGKPEGCRNCSSPLVPGQDWCLECGAAGEGRLRRVGGWRSAASVSALTLLMVAGIAAASYAALSSDSHRTAARTPVAQVTPAPAGPAAVVPPAATVPAPATPVKPVLPPRTPPPVVPTTIKPGALPKLPTTIKPVVTPKTTPVTVKPVVRPAKPVGPQPILLDTDAASTYDPSNHPQGTFGDPSNAIDQDTATAWTAALDPKGDLNAGLILDLKSAHKIDYLRVTTDTPGMAVEIYASNADPAPAQITDPGWIHLASAPSLRHRQTLKLLTAGKTYRRVLVWIPHGAGGSSPGSQVDVAELGLLP